jgi:hypothetical protein
MLRLVDVTSVTSSGITFYTEEVTSEGYVPYIVYDTDTVTSLASMRDYYCWRALTVASSTGDGVTFEASNTYKYPSYEADVADYTLFDPSLFRIMTFQEFQILQNTLIRLDLVRRRMPNPGAGLSSIDGVGQDGIVSYTGGFEKKMAVDEIMRMMEGAIVELNATSPQTYFWPRFMSLADDKRSSPYLSQGMPYDMLDIATLGTMIRCLMALGILEIDISFSTSDSGLQLTFDRDTKIKSWYDAMLTEYKESKTLFKWNYANHSGVGIGTVPWAAYGIWGTMMNNVTYGGQLAFSSLLGFAYRGNTPM